MSRVATASPLASVSTQEHVNFSRQREFLIDNLLVRIHFIIEMIWWTGLAPFEFQNGRSWVWGAGFGKVEVWGLGLPGEEARRMQSPRPAYQVKDV